MAKLRNDTGCMGLVNQGATCYLNSVLTQLFAERTVRAQVRTPCPLPLPLPLPPSPCDP